MVSSASHSELTAASLKQIKDDLSNLCMEARLSLEMEMENNKDLLSQVNTSFQTIVSKYSKLNEAYTVECARRRKVGPVEISNG